MRDPLVDKDFLRKLDEQKLKEVYAKIISLDFNENPIEEISGRITQGSISINGQSAIRRTCSLTLIANKDQYDNFNLHEYYWGLNQKIRVYIGLNNTIDNRYPEIVWFPQGTYIISQFNTSQGINSYSISVQAKDKMCLLNGEVGGSITALSFDFGTEDYIDGRGNITNRKLLIKEIIKEIVHEYAKEPYHNIVINDLDTTGLELLEYRGENPLYLVVNSDGIIEQFVASNFKNTLLYYGPIIIKEGKKTCSYCPIDDLENQKDKFYDHRIKLDLDVDKKQGPTKVYVSEKDCTEEQNPKTIIECEYGDVVGYKLTDLTYAGDLVGQAGNSITSACLDKLVQMLGDYEYFYNVEGQFVFQRKKTYLNSVFNNSVTGGSEFIKVNLTEEEFESAIKNKQNVYENTENTRHNEDFSLKFFANDIYSLINSSYKIVEEWSEGKEYYLRRENEDFHTDAIETSPFIYSFENSVLISSFSNNPDLMKIKNDFSIWGQREGMGKKVYPVHLRFAIDKKPVYYRTYNGKNFYLSKDYQFDSRDFNEEELKEGKDVIENNKYDWRELIYQMAMDYSLYGHKDDFVIEVRRKNPRYYPSGYTGYEPYYTDMLGFWRQLYYPNFTSDYQVVYCSLEDYKENPTSYYWFKEYTEEEFNDSETYYRMDLKNGYIKVDNNQLVGLTPENYSVYIEEQGDSNKPYSQDTIYYKKRNNTEEEIYNSETNWHKSIINAPETINFWFDFLDTDGDLGKYSCNIIGNRTKAINDTNIKAIYFRETPSIVWTDYTITDDEFQAQKRTKPGYNFLKIKPNLENLFSISSQGVSAVDKLNELLYTDAICAENINITAVPIYYLEPNTRIFVRDDNSGINGEYIISNINYNNLGPSGMMTISAIKANERIY